MIGELITTGYTYHDGRVAINNAFSGTAIFNVVSAQTINIATIGGTTSITNLGMHETSLNTEVHSVGFAA